MLFCISWLLLHIWFTNLESLVCVLLIGLPSTVECILGPTYASTNIRMNTKLHTLVRYFLILTSDIVYGSTQRQSQFMPVLLLWFHSFIGRIRSLGIGRSNFRLLSRKTVPQACMQGSPVYKCYPACLAIKHT